MCSRGGYFIERFNVAHTDEQQSTIDSVNESNAVFRSVVANVQADQWDLPTVNDDWTVRGVVNHIIGGSTWTANIASGAGSDWPEGDLIGSADPLQAHQAAHDAMLAAYADPEAWDRTMQSPMGEMPASLVLTFRTSELVHHAWDVAQATGQSTDVAPEQSQKLLDGMRDAFANFDRNDAGFQQQFKPETPVADDASAADRLAAFLGKRVQ